jgi:glutamine amidotransferase-like uncharacterized protein
MAVPSLTILPSFQEPVVVKILSGEHFSHESVKALVHIVSKFFNKFELQKVKEHDLHFKELGNRKILLIIPGTSDIKAIDLSLEQQELINLYAAHGAIKVLAVCAGAFYASKSLIYNGERRHSDKQFFLFRGSACGPAFMGDDPKWNISSQSISLEGIIPRETGYATFIKGGFFIPDPELIEEKDYFVLSRYEKLPARPIAALACLSCAKSDFHAVLMGPHVEFDAEDESFESLKTAFAHKAPCVEKIVEDLHTTTAFRLHFFQQVFSRLGFK